MRNLLISQKEPNSNNAQNANIGSKEMKAVRPWHANADNIFAILAEESGVPMAHAAIQEGSKQEVPNQEVDFLVSLADYNHFAFTIDLGNSCNIWCLYIIFKLEWSSKSSYCDTTHPVSF